MVPLIQMRVGVFKYVTQGQMAMERQDWDFKVVWFDVSLST